MTYGEYFNQHPDQNVSWCKCYADKTDEYFLVMYSAEPLWAKTPTETYNVMPRHCGDTSNIEAFAKAVNNGYHCYHGWTDEEIALDVMHEIGCSACPFRHECEVMNEEME